MSKIHVSCNRQKCADSLKFCLRSSVKLVREKTKPLLVSGIIHHSDNIFGQFEEENDKNFDILTMSETRRDFWTYSHLVATWKFDKTNGLKNRKNSSRLPQHVWPLETTWFFVAQLFYIVELEIARPFETCTWWFCRTDNVEMGGPARISLEITL